MSDTVILDRSDYEQLIFDIQIISSHVAQLERDLRDAIREDQDTEDSDDQLPQAG